MQINGKSRKELERVANQILKSLGYVENREYVLAEVQMGDSWWEGVKSNIEVETQ